MGAGMGNELDEVTGPTHSGGRDVNVIDKQLKVEIGQGTKIFELSIWVLGVVAAAAQFREPHRVARYLEELAGVYHGFYADCRVLPLGDEVASPLHSARANLCAATKQVIKNGLDLLGVSAPERM